MIKLRQNKQSLIFRASLKVFFLVIFVAHNFALAQNIVFSGRPNVKISESGIARSIEDLSPIQSKNYSCVISEIDGVYYWTSRNNKRLVRVSISAFTTYIATDGSGYIRVIEPNLKDAAALASSTEERFDYSEHLTFGLRAITYYGVSK